MDSTLYSELTDELQRIDQDGLYKRERIIVSPQSGAITVNDQQVLNFCANNYLGLANHPALIDAAKRALDSHGFGMASVRFICGTQDLHKDLEAKIARFFGTEDTILYSSCWDANGGLFETILSAEDAVISDALNHASIIDGVRLCKAERYRYANCDLNELETHLKATQHKRHRLITTDGVFSMDGTIAPLKDIVALAKQYRALIHVDDSHATGFVGARGRGSAEHHGVLDQVDIYTSTLGKALGGGSGGFTTGRQALIELLRQRSRPYLFSNSVPPPLVAASAAAIDLIDSSDALRAQLNANAAHFRARMSAAGFTLKPGEHPIIPVMLMDAALAQRFAAALLAEGVYVIGFFFPVVPKGQARIRTQMSAAHTLAQVDEAVDAFIRVGRSLGVIG
jgi:glycine C-acetyltransferase